MALVRQELSSVAKQIDGLMDRIVDAESPTVIAAYEKRIEKLEREKLVLKEKLQNSGGRQRASAEVFELALSFPSNS